MTPNKRTRWTALSAAADANRGLSQGDYHADAVAPGELFLTLVASGKVREAYQEHVGEGFRHHNPAFPGTAAVLMEAMEQNAAQNPNKVLEVLEIKTTLQEGNRVAVFSHERQNPKDRGGRGPFVQVRG